MVMAVVVSLYLGLVLGTRRSSQDLLGKDSDLDHQEPRHCQSQPLVAAAAVEVLYLLGTHQSSWGPLGRDSDLDHQESRHGQSRPLAVAVAVLYPVAAAVSIYPVAVE